MRKRVFLLMIVNILIVNEVISQSLLTYASDNSEIESKKTDRLLPTYEFKGYSKDNELEKLSIQISGNHLFGETVAKKYYLFDDMYTTEVAVVPGNPQTRTLIKKPIIYEAVKRIEKDLRKSIKKGEISIDYASMEFEKVLDVALNILTADTKKFEEEIKTINSVNSRIDLFTKRVNLKY